MKATAYLIVMVMLASAWGVILSAGDTADAWVMDKMNKTQDDMELEFIEGGGENDEVTLILPKDVPIYNARMGISGVGGGGGALPRDLWVDIGRDGDAEWMFSGEGYGRLGRQYMFSDNATSLKIPFRNEEVNDTYSFYLPKGATVTSATMDVTGAAGMNDGLIIKRDTGTALALYYSSSYWTESDRPMLTINYVGGTSTVIQPDEVASKDARGQEGDPDTNYEDQMTNRYLTYGWPSSTLGNSYGFVQFDLSSVPPTPQVSSAEFRMRYYSYQADQQFDIHEVTEEWEEGTLTWNDMPAYNPEPEDSQTVIQGYGYSIWDVTDMVKFWLADQFPSDVKVDLGGDGKVEYGMIGELSSTVHTDDFSAVLNDYLDDAPAAFTDEYGNRFVKVYMEVASTSSGYVDIGSLDIEYDWQGSIRNNPHNFNLTNELNELMESIPPVGGKVTIPVSVHSGTAGKVRLEKVNITYNGAPVLAASIPSDLGVDEDTADANLLDLSEYFEDDYLASSQLIYEIVWNSKEDLVDVKVADGHYLSVDASGEAARNFNGNTTIEVTAMDELGFVKRSNQFIVTILPVNDEPVRGEEGIPDLSLSEGGTTKPLKLDKGKYFTDIEDDELFFTAVVDPLDNYDGENITVDIDNEAKEMTVTANGDFFGEDVPLRIFCDDGVGGEANVYWDLLVDVANRDDDAPFWEALDDIHIDEEGRLDDAFNVRDLVGDVDNSVDSLRFTIPSATNSTYVKVRIDDSGFVDIQAVGDNWTGRSDVTLRATDTGENYAEVGFTVFVDPVNDLPLVKLTAPARDAVMTSEQVTLVWEGNDAETLADELTYTIYVGEGSTETALAEGVEGTSYTLDVMDGRAYHWTVLADDGEVKGPKARGRDFSVDFASGPRTVLKSPSMGMVVTVKDVELKWGLEPRPGGKGADTLYDVYLGETPDGMEPIGGGVPGTTLVAGGLTDKNTYFWQVIPTDTLGRGTCQSGVWTFDVDLDFTGYGVDLALSPGSISLKAGELGVVTATVVNIGAADDVYHITAEIPDVPGARITYEGGDAEALALASGGRADLTISAEIPGSTAPGEYTMTVKAVSANGGLEETAEVRVEVKDAQAPGGTNDDDGTNDRKAADQEGGVLSDILSLPVLMLIAVMIAVVGAAAGMYRSKSRKVAELEARQRAKKAKMVDAEITISSGPGLAGGGAVGAGAAAQLGTGAPAVVTAAGGAPAQPLLALPKVATGGIAPLDGGPVQVVEAVPVAPVTAAGAPIPAAPRTAGASPAVGAPPPAEATASAGHPSTLQAPQTAGKAPAPAGAPPKTPMKLTVPVKPGAPGQGPGPKAPVISTTPDTLMAQDRAQAPPLKPMVTVASRPTPGGTPPPPGPAGGPANLGTLPKK